MRGDPGSNTEDLEPYNEAPGSNTEDGGLKTQDEDMRMESSGFVSLVR